MSSFVQYVMFIAMLIGQNQKFINQVFFEVPLQPMNTYIIDR